MVSRVLFWVCGIELRSVSLADALALALVFLILSHKFLVLVRLPIVNCLTPLFSAFAFRGELPAWCRVPNRCQRNQPVRGTASQPEHCRSKPQHSGKRAPAATLRRPRNDRSLQSRDAPREGLGSALQYQAKGCPPNRRCWSVSQRERAQLSELYISQLADVDATRRDRTGLDWTARSTQHAAADIRRAAARGCCRSNYAIDVQV